MTQTLPMLEASQRELTLPPVFMTAEWRYLAMLNYQVEPDVLMPLVPRGTELDFWHGQTFVSLVGFSFLNARIGGIAIPFHRSFTEVNLRFYVLRRHQEGDRRGVVFVREIVPKLAAAAVARLVYNEHFTCLPMRSRIEQHPMAVEYEWRFRRRWCGLRVGTGGCEPRLPSPGSLEEFIVEHYWAYTRRTDGGCNEYRIEHPAWRIWDAERVNFEADVEGLYGETFAGALRNEPVSAFIADGSAVKVRKGVRLC